MLQDLCLGSVRKSVRKRNLQWMGSLCRAVQQSLGPGGLQWGHGGFLALAAIPGCLGEK